MKNEWIHLSGRSSEKLSLVCLCIWNKTMDFNPCFYIYVDLIMSKVFIITIQIFSSYCEAEDFKSTKTIYTFYHMRGGTKRRLAVDKLFQQFQAWSSTTISSLWTELRMWCTEQGGCIVKLATISMKNWLDPPQPCPSWSIWGLFSQKQKIHDPKIQHNMDLQSKFTCSKFQITVLF